MSRSTARANHASKKARETRHQNEALDTVQAEIKETTARLKSLKAEKSEIAASKPGKGRSSNAESSSSGKVTGVSKQTKAKRAAKVSTAKKGESLKLHTFLLSF